MRTPIPSHWSLNKIIRDFAMILSSIHILLNERHFLESNLFNRPNSQIPQSNCPISHNAPFRTEMCTFLFWMVHCGIWDKCIVGFVSLAFSHWSFIEMRLRGHYGCYVISSLSSNESPVYFGKFQGSWAVVTSAKYECDMAQVNYISKILRNGGSWKASGN